MHRTWSSMSRLSWANIHGLFWHYLAPCSPPLVSWSQSSVNHKYKNQDNFKSRVFFLLFLPIFSTKTKNGSQPELTFSMFRKLLVGETCFSSSFWYWKREVTFKSTLHNPWLPWQFLSIRIALLVSHTNVSYPYQSSILDKIKRYGKFDNLSTSWFWFSLDSSLIFTLLILVTHWLTDSLTPVFSGLR